MPDNQIEPRSKGLVGLSSAIIIFVLGGGQFPDEAVLWYGTISFERIGVIKLSFFLIFLYTFYRYFVYSDKTWEKFTDSVKRKLDINPAFERYVSSLENVAISNYLRDVASKHKDHSIDNFSASWFKSATGVSTNKKHGKIIVQFNIHQVIGVNSGIEIDKVKVPLNKVRYWLCFWKVAVITDHPFAYLMPWVLGSFALLCSIWFIFENYILNGS